MSTMPPSDRDSKPNPDPTAATNEAVERAVQAERDYVKGEIFRLEERLRGIDVATKLLNESVNRVPTDVTKEVTHLRELMEGHFESVALQFRERDVRSEREARDNSTKVDAAFAAQKEAAARQDESNSKSIDKSEKSTNDAIVKLAELLKTQTDALRDKIEDVKATVNGIESVKRGSTEQLREHREGMSSTQQFAGTVIAVILVVLALLAYQSRNNDQPVTPVVTVTTP